MYLSGQIIIFHQPRFNWNKGISLTKPQFGVRSCEVAIIWPDLSIYIYIYTIGIDEAPSPIPQINRHSAGIESCANYEYKESTNCTNYTGVIILPTQTMHYDKRNASNLP